MERLQNLLKYIMVILFIYSCSNHSYKTHDNLDYSQIKQYAISENKWFCFILIDSLFNRFQYEEALYKNYKGADIILNYINIDNPSNKWYKYLLSSNRIPFTLVFSPTGNLKNVIYGFSQYSFKALASVVNSTHKNSRYSNFGFASNSIIGDTPNVINQLDCIILSKININKKTTQNINDLNLTIKLMPYPYNLYLKVLQEKLLEHKDSVLHYGNILMSNYCNQEYIDIYHDLFNDVSTFIEEIAKMNHHTNLELSINKNILYSNIGDTIKIKVKASNNNPKFTTSISEIKTSCDCLKLSSDFITQIKPLHTVYYEFQLIPDKKGELYREIYFLSDANTPIEVVSFRAFVN